MEVAHTFISGHSVQGFVFVLLPAQYPYLCVPGNVLSGYSRRSFCTTSSLLHDIGYWCTSCFDIFYFHTEVCTASFLCAASFFLFFFFGHEMRNKSQREGVFAYNCIWYYIVYPINKCYISYNVYFIFKKLCYIFKTEQGIFRLL